MNKTICCYVDLVNQFVFSYLKIFFNCVYARGGEYVSVREGAHEGQRWESLQLEYRIL